ncbi:2,5-diamino-6-(ribosylamino)-4(3H)-pyrimidinone 5'-phosphate reductase [Terrimicrobium sacchariphilum]|uniref:2,5-diamino-6-(Ribosylamino)-4(3H)-pyrimidinone 5'-phosphate reductase n=1 Tax=Terrimicrobium sacchariphilum TaxID=690879 RepID=A0A146G8Z0_TERSA|nr:RibD family protein [Terrimicrobium sacchariphilum]GAT33753.1 2,5-diamino-6-(ribosylamino)-4(3H)-pyrimidinone 5'-phosphate reductase [Terrimicrobium sacchariphilum]
MKASRLKVSVNFAITADGKVSTRKKTASGFTSESDKRRFREIRAEADAVMVGVGTLTTDNMSMGVSDPAQQRARKKRGQSPQPLRVVVSASGRFDPKAKIFTQAGAPIVIFSTQAMPERVRSWLAAKADVWLFETSVDLAEMMRILRADYRIRSVICEGGPTLFRSLLEADLVDTLHLTWAPVIFGGREASTLTGLPGEFLPHLVRFKLSSQEVLGGECFLTYRIKRQAKTPAPQAASATRQSPRPPGRSLG